MARYANTDQLAIRMQLLSTPTVDQLEMLNEILSAASRSIDRTCGMSDDAFLATDEATTRYFPSNGKKYLRIPESTEIVFVAVKDSISADTYTTWVTPTTPMAGDGDWVPSTGEAVRPTYGVLPYTLLIIDTNGNYNSFLGGGSVSMVAVTAYWGHSDIVPDDIREACLMQSVRWYKKFQAAMSSRGASADLGEIIYRKSLDSDIRQILIEGRWVIPFYGRVE